MAAEISLFEQEAIVKSLGDHLSALEGILNWTLLIAIPVAWAGIRREETVKAGFLEIRRKHAFYAVASLFIMINLACLVIFLRIGDLIDLLDQQTLKKGLSAIAFHPWPFNPFSFYGTGLLARVQSCAGFGLLILIWWIGYSAMATFRASVGRRESRRFALIFLLLGLASMSAINRCHIEILGRLYQANRQAYEMVLRTIFERVLAAFIRIGFGGVIYRLTFRLQRTLLPEVPMRGEAD